MAPRPQRTCGLGCCSWVAHHSTLGNVSGLHTNHAAHEQVRMAVDVDHTHSCRYINSNAVCNKHTKACAIDGRLYIVHDTTTTQYVPEAMVHFFQGQTQCCGKRLLWTPLISHPMRSLVPFPYPCGPTAMTHSHHSPCESETCCPCSSLSPCCECGG